MLNALSKELISIPQREVAGPRASKQFAYQKNWALTELIKYHLAGKDYVFAFEFHDDVLILDSETSPSSLHFVQVKTNTKGKNWTIKQLVHSVNGKGGNPNKLSIIGKLYENGKKFSAFETSLKFVTNVYFSFSNTSSTICANTLEEKEQELIKEAVKLQLNVNESISVDNLFFEHSSLSFEDHEDHIRGKLHTFFESLFGTDHNIAISPWYQSISDQIKKKNDYPPDKINNFNDLIRNKCITKNEIEAFIKKVHESQSSVGYWLILKDQLVFEGYEYKQLIRLHESWKQFITDRLDYNNEALRAIEIDIDKELKNINSTSLKVKIEKVKNNLNKELSELNHLFNDDYITCIIIWVDCEQL